jgi:phospholipid-binding lipoprotein MlaA
MNPMNKPVAFNIPLPGLIGRVLLVILLLGVFSPILDRVALGSGIETADVDFVQRNHDPFEGFNRSMYQFNERVDRAVLKPLAIRYVEHVPPPVRTGVRNFMGNLREPTTIVNGLLQGKVRQAGKDTLRFVINTTFGLLGIIDLASYFQLEQNREDFGQTMGKWGVPPGPYLVLPLLGPSTVRDTVGLIPQYMYTDLTSGIDSDSLLWSLFATRAVDTRSSLLRADAILAEQIDPYVFVRESYLQRRLVDVWDGQLPEQEDEFLEELLNEGN